jgi:hypothetical protein
MYQNIGYVTENGLTKNINVLECTMLLEQFKKLTFANITVFIFSYKKNMTSVKLSLKSASGFLARYLLSNNKNKAENFVYFCA